MADSVRQPINIFALNEYIIQNIPEIQVPITLKQFSHGQSNPTYEISSSSGKKFVLRKKPPGIILSKSAHRIDREFEVIKALEGTEVPVPKIFVYCEDPSIIGTSFYIMEFLDGRIFNNPWLPELRPSQRNDIWKEAVRTLGKLHSANMSDIGLDSWKRVSKFYDRQIKSLDRVSKAQAKSISRFSGQEVGQIPHYEALMSFFANAKLQPLDRRSLVHGDFKLDNLVFHKTEPWVIGILDWEMATEGHPLSDFVNLVSPFLWAPGEVPVLAEQSLTGDVKDWQHNFHPGATPGLPSLTQCERWYRNVVGWDPRQDMKWAMAFSNFRTAIIMQGITSRLVTGQASGIKAKQFASQTVPYALWSYARIQKIQKKGNRVNKL